MSSHMEAEPPSKVKALPGGRKIKTYLSTRMHFVPLVALGIVLLVDAFLYAFAVSIFQLGILDQIAHLATALIIFFLIAPYTSTYFKLGGIASTVLIDLDHLPLFWGSDFLTTGAGRPMAHTLLAIAVTLALVGVLKGKAQRAMLGAVLGITVHLFRDMATGGVPLLWPFDSRTVQISYVVYMTTIGLLAALGFRLALIREQFRQQWNRTDTTATNRWKSIRRFTIRR